MFIVLGLLGVGGVIALLVFGEELLMGVGCVLSILTLAAVVVGIYALTQGDLETALICLLAFLVLGFFSRFTMFFDI
ncbi:hypothetical protein [Nocardiopsis nanhaiensis]